MTAAASSRLVYLLLAASVWCRTLLGTAAQADEDLHFEDLPAQSEVVSVTTRAPGTLDGYFTLPHSFIDAVLPGSIPYELINPLVGGLAGSLFGDSLSAGEEDVASGGLGTRQLFTRQATGSSGGGSGDSGTGGNDNTPNELGGSIQEIITQFAARLIPVLVMVAVGLLLAILITCGGCCLCCCRLCGKCGAKGHRYHSKNQNAKCLIWTVIFLLAISMIIIGIVLGFLSNQKISDSVRGLENTANSALLDGVNYLNNTVNQVVFIATDQFTVTTDRIVSNIHNIGTLLGDAIHDRLEDGANSAFGQVTEILNSFVSLQMVEVQLLHSVNVNYNVAGGKAIEVIHDTSCRVNATATQLLDLQAQINAHLFSLREGLSNLSMTCVAIAVPGTCDLISSPDSIDITVDWNTVGDLTGVLELLDEIDVDGVRGSIANATQLFNNIGALITEQTGNIDINSVVIRSQESIQNVIGGVQNTINIAISAEGAAGQIQDGITNYLGSGVVGLYDGYRYGAVSGLLSLMVLIWLVYLVGIFCGVFGYSRHAFPFERSSISHCGALLLLFGVAMCFLTAGLLLILTTLSFLLGTSIQLVCNDASPSEYILFREVTDNPSLWGGRTLVGAITSGTIGLPVNISISSFLRGCEGDEPLWRALQADSVINLNSTLSNLTGPLADFSLGNSFALPVEFSSGLIPEETRDRLEDIERNVVAPINFTNYENLLNQSVVEFDVEVIYGNLTMLAMVQSNMSLEANYTLTVLDTLVDANSTLQDFQEQLDFLQGNVAVLQTSTQNISTWVMQVLGQLDALLNRTVDVVAMESEMYLERQIQYVYDYVDYVQSQVQNEVGRCGPVSAAYNGTFIAICNEALDGLNGFWFSIGWCIIFFLPAIVSGVVLTCYFRRSPSDIHTFTEQGDTEDRFEVHPNRAVTGTRYIDRTIPPHIPSEEWY